MRQPTTRRTDIPRALNMTILCVAGACTLAMLALAAHTTSWLVLVVAAVGFSYLNNTIFALLHEATHGMLHPDARWNAWLGRIAAAFFPTSFSLQRAFHLTHHRNNRTESEQFDYLRPRDNKLLKLAQWYSILTGLYWAFVPLGCLLYCLLPNASSIRPLRNTSSLATQTSAAAYLGSLDTASGTAIRLEILLSASLQFGAAWALGVTPAAWLVCYGAFAVNWSALQYADHAWSPLDVHDGAWNLRVNPLIRWLFLNYHHHLAHHRYPTVPWIYLPALVDKNEPQPSFLRIWLSMWRGPKPFPEPARAQ